MAGFDGSVLCWIPDIPYQGSEEWRLRKAQFSDGYMQRTLDGINALERTWSLTWRNREPLVINAMLTYLANLKAQSFMFKDPGTGLSWRVFCDRWQVSWDIRRRGGHYYGTLSAEFKKANGVQV